VLFLFRVIVAVVPKALAQADNGWPKLLCVTSLTLFDVLLSTIFSQPTKSCIVVRRKDGFQRLW
jgi:hypothetical protein